MTNYDLTSRDDGPLRESRASFLIRARRVLATGGIATIVADAASDAIGRSSIAEAAPYCCGGSTACTQNICPGATTATYINTCCGTDPNHTEYDCYDCYCSGDYVCTYAGGGTPNCPQRPAP